MRIILFGATGMIGRGVLLECLADPNVSHVLSIGRRATDMQHVKLEQIVHDDFTDYSGIGEHLVGFDACFCIWRDYSAGVVAVRIGVVRENLGGTFQKSWKTPAIHGEKSGHLTPELTPLFSVKRVSTEDRSCC